MNLHVESSEHQRDDVSLGIVWFLKDLRVGKEEGASFFCLLDPTSVPCFISTLYSRFLSEGVKFRISLQQQMLASAFTSGSISTKAWGTPHGEAEQMHGCFCPVPAETPRRTGQGWWSNIPGTMHEVTQGPWEHLGESRARVWAGAGASGPWRDLQSHSQGDTRALTKPDVGADLQAATRQTKVI